MTGCTPNADAIAEAIADVEAHMGGDPALYPNFCRELLAWCIWVDTMAPDAPDAADVFIAAHCILFLARNASDRASFNLLKRWLSGDWTNTAELTAASVAWSRHSAAARRDALDRIAQMADDVERTCSDYERADEMREDVTELRLELASLREEGGTPELTELGWMPTFPAVRSLARAVRAYRRAYPGRFSQPLSSLAAVTQARASIARSVTP